MRHVLSSACYRMLCTLKKRTLTCTFLKNGKASRVYKDNESLRRAIPIAASVSSAQVLVTSDALQLVLDNLFDILLALAVKSALTWIP